MVNIIICGCSGKMGHTLVSLISERTDAKVVAGVDAFESHYDFPIFKSFEDCNIKADVIIDFSHFSVIPSLLKYSVETMTPAVICTTGIDEDLASQIEEASKKVALFRSGNMSLGINVLIDLARKAAKILGEDFDIEIIEKHHKRKLDSPSGTAYMIAEEINDELDNTKEYIYGRYGRDAKRKPTEIGIHGVRGGSIVGEHSVLFAGANEVIEINHSAMSRDVFASGAIKAALFIKDLEPGLYEMNDLINHN